jgi:hypothetical protein
VPLSYWIRTSFADPMETLGEAWFWGKFVSTLNTVVYCPNPAALFW